MRYERPTRTAASCPAWMSRYTVMLDTRSWPATSATVTKLDSVSFLGTRSTTLLRSRAYANHGPAQRAGRAKRDGGVETGRPGGGTPELFCEGKLSVGTLLFLHRTGFASQNPDRNTMKRRVRQHGARVSGLDRARGPAPWPPSPPRAVRPAPRPTRAPARRLPSSHRARSPRRAGRTAPRPSRPAGGPTRAGSAPSDPGPRGGSDRPGPRHR